MRWASAVNEACAIVFQRTDPESYYSPDADRIPERMAANR